MATITYLTRIELEPGALSGLPSFLAQFKMERPLMVTDQGVVSAGLLARLQRSAPAVSSVFDQTPQNPTETAVLAALDRYREENCDGLVALGGGSSIDLAKALRLLVHHEEPLSHYAATAGGISKITANMPPLIAIPTTAGTGSEVGRGAIINLEDGRKLGILSPHLLPSLALCDPELTLGLPPFLTAATGMDAMSHCLETYMSSAINPPANAIALDGLTRAMRALPKAVKDGGDLDARLDMMTAAMEGAMAFQKGLGAVHALTHPLGAIKDLNLHHGTLNAILMPVVLRFNRSVIGGKWDTLSNLMGGEPDRILETMNKDIGIPSGLNALGLEGTHLDAVARAALKDHCHATNPRLATEFEYRSLLEEAR
ncbi:hypothetical protein JM93_00648 [Roseibium hamelinense]|uniref:Uncharacterized protein n=1 Tax=Roseibium hamelinense TaxID=150831 RepID=A0A562TIA4_9HYPH|nr:iron-containing alcohol dehydrogenase [Roseibium hamelinense]MTI45724.1 iron-containing alcohol dehydrogenase [Roseibium hamelinense]TWI93093.1 hypothetical protein JM93_00648 [Roseibium hamelinense]